MKEQWTCGKGEVGERVKAEEAAVRVCCTKECTMKQKEYKHSSGFFIVHVYAWVKYSRMKNTKYKFMM